MPKRPKGQKRPADAIGFAAIVVRLAIQDITETTAPSSAKRISRGAGSPARQRAPTEERRRQTAEIAAEVRW